MPSTRLSGVYHLLEGRLIDDTVVVEGGLNQAFGDVKVSGRGVDVVLARFLGVDVRLKVGERAEERLREGPLELLRSDFAADNGPSASSPDQMMSPRLRLSSNRREWDQAERRASRLARLASSRNRRA